MPPKIKGVEETKIVKPEELTPAEIEDEIAAAEPEESPCAVHHRATAEQIEEFREIISDVVEPDDQIDEPPPEGVASPGKPEEEKPEKWLTKIQRGLLIR